MSIIPAMVASRMFSGLWRGGYVVEAPLKIISASERKEMIANCGVCKGTGVNYLSKIDMERMRHYRQPISCSCCGD